MLDQTAMPLLEALRVQAHRAHAPFYTPGHKRGQGIAQPLADLLGTAVFQADLPELPDLDNLFSPEGVIGQAQELAAEAFGADRTWFLANGSTCGLEAAILAVCKSGEKIVLPRNVHRSAIAALVLSGAIPIFVEPDYDPQLGIAHSITPDSVAHTLKQHPDVKAVLVVYPTYYGVCGDIRAIAQVVRQHGIPLLVDEAHGAHFGFHPDLPISALSAGADLVVQSTHKLLGAMTQAAMLHVQGTRVDGDRLSQTLQLVQSTSPSYLLLASLDAARQQMATQGKQLMTQTLALAHQARTQLSQISGLSVLGAESAGLTPGFVALDPTRLTVTTTGLGLTGFAADEILHQQLGVTAELPSFQHLTFIISLGNTASDIEQLINAFNQLSSQHASPSAQLVGRVLKPIEKVDFSSVTRTKNQPLKQSLIPNSQSPISPRQAFFAPTETLAIAHTIGHISAEIVCPYPPGIPVLLPGEEITEGAIAYLQQVMAAGGVITGCADPNLDTLKVVKL
ncbi:aminotransferase class I/II-fold pyridoxal phosphate-dependent enzyme [Leptolyngbya sp. FACHB-671]|uniref:aminotransferase class I/II-fold pyridoxal phosphate-dependent enzyme n=1 Tax=Leptolyngbya sp. FACHB-671 TaxID=2692812 RepID=UPI001683281E|nr:aminotransferase class I/II-fold pyridoxal phosphate-dependent enzyme [Leptolyngbya sp. FACHB-671]MBD2070864.1 aminotransferase class I/II-fold pyridoxal phosphate-dependent enzyme [Leptolyngbya sp. FACHB-671]